MLHFFSRFFFLFIVLKGYQIQKYVVLVNFYATFVNSKVAFVNSYPQFQIVKYRFMPQNEPQSMSDYHNIRVRKINKEKIKLLAKRSGKSETEYANRMILYIYNSGLDIFTEISPNVPDMLKAMDRRIVSFLKKREQDFFVPMQNSFREMIRVHNQTLQTLDILHPGEIGFKKNEKKEVENTKEKGFIIPKNNDLKATDIVVPEDDKTKVEPEQKNSSFSATERDNFLQRIERAEKEKETFEKELKYLLKNLESNKSISGPKFTCNLPQKEIDRIKHLVDGY
ncbi:BfmA/BtgA family mobilization protein [Flagellimonas sp. C4]|uniref:BfmA/BtgA family mobilization protein n=1 Tax=Flagellimonas alginolytica TaxID=3177515 RepID=UPI0035C8FC5B